MGGMMCFDENWDGWRLNGAGMEWNVAYPWIKWNGTMEWNG